jgi:hypothetical protein
MTNNIKSREAIDLEQFAKEGKTPETGEKYKIKIDQKMFIVEVECMLGEEILTLAEKTPITRFQLNAKIKGVVEKVENKQTICFTTPGLEKFMTIPLDQTEG